MEEMSKEVLSLIWKKIPEKNRDFISSKISETIREMMQKDGVVENKPHNWCMNFAFDKENPKQYVFAKGFFVLVQGLNEDHKPALIVMNSYIHLHVSDDVDDFLDRMDDINKIESPLFTKENIKKT